MRKMISKKGTKAVKKAQVGVNFDFDETNRYAGGRGFPSRFMSAAYEAQPYVKAKRAEEARRKKMTQEQRDIQEINARRIGAGVAGPAAGSKPGGRQRKGGTTKKAEGGVIMEKKPKRAPQVSMHKKAAQKKVTTKAKYGVAKKSSSRRSK
jgi:hypothetical protein